MHDFSAQSAKAEDTLPVHHGRRHSRHSRSRQVRWIILLSFTLILETTLLLLACIRVSVVERHNRELLLEAKQREQELEALQPEVQQLREQVATLAQSRLPGLHVLEFDQVIPLDREYVRNIVFTAAGKDDQRRYEFKMVLRNPNRNQLHPQVDLLLFDRFGVQVGRALVGVEDDGTPTRDFLEPGETRSYSGYVALDDRAEPGFFRIKMHH